MRLSASQSPLINARLERSKLLRQGDDERLIELHSVLDEAAEVALSAQEALRELGQAENPREGEARDAFDAAEARVCRCERRLAIRLGPDHSAYRAFSEFARMVALIPRQFDKEADLATDGRLADGSNPGKALGLMQQHDRTFQAEASKMIRPRTLD